MYGGFDGQEELSTLHLFTFSRVGDARSHDGQARLSYSVSWQLIQPRNQPPPPRSHHSMSYYKAGRMALVFGGYSSVRGGLIGELWAFSFDHMEWSQPETFGRSTPASCEVHFVLLYCLMSSKSSDCVHRGAHCRGGPSSCRKLCNQLRREVQGSKDSFIYRSDLFLLDHDANVQGMHPLREGAMCRLKLRGCLWYMAVLRIKAST
jgi:hypothetical protein